MLKRMHLWLARRSLGVMLILLLAGYLYMFVLVLQLLGGLR